MSERRVAPRHVSLVVRAVAAAALGAGGLALAGASLGAPSAGAVTAPAAHPAATAPKAIPHNTPSPKAPNTKNRGKTAPQVSSTPDIAPLTAGHRTFVVNTTADGALETAGSTTCVDTATQCSLRAAIQAADNDTANTDLVTVPVGTYALTADLGTLEITNNVHLVGVGAATVVVDAQHAIELMDIHSTTPGFAPSVLISGITLQNGTASSGGDVYLEDADLTLEATTVTGGHASSAGGDIYETEASALWTDGGTVISTGSAEYGGGVYAYGTVSINDTTFATNSATYGGAIYDTSAISSENATFSGNSAVGGGGAVYNDYSFTDSTSTYIGNSLHNTNTNANTGPFDQPASVGDVSYGAVLENTGTAQLTNVTVATTSTSATDVYGGVFYTASELTLINVSVSATHNADSSDIYGGVLYDTKYVNVNAYDLTVTGTTNGTAGSDAYVDGGVLYTAEEGNATLNGAHISATTNLSNDEIEGGVVAITDYGSLSMTGATIFGTTDRTSTATGATDVDGGVLLGWYPKVNVTAASIATTTVSSGDASVDGGAVYTYTYGSSLENLSIANTSVTTAGSDVYGGALSTEGETGVQILSITGTTVDDTGNGDGFVGGGAWYNDGQLTANDAQVLGAKVTVDDYLEGGAFDNDGTKAILSNSTFAGVTATSVGVTDGIYGSIAYYEETTSTTNVTMDDSTATAATGTAASSIYIDDSVQFTNDTIAHDTERAAAGTLSTSTSGGIVMERSGYTESFKNTIVATTPSSLNCVKNGTTSAFTSAGGNIDSGSSCGFGDQTDQSTVTPMVAAVANNGGPVQSAALLPGSPALGHGVSAGAPSHDARGVVRPSTDIDVGAYQASGVRGASGGPGYYEEASDGGIFAFTAPFHGSMGGHPLNAPIVSMAVDPATGGYYEVASDGGIFAFTAPFRGSMGGHPLNAPIVGIAVLPDGKGYYEVASDGGIFAFTAPFHGSMGGKPLNKPIVGMAIAPTGKGYYEVASDGGIFAFGTVVFHGSMGGHPLNAPIVGMAELPNGKGYYEVASDGGIFAFGTVVFHGSMGGHSLVAPIVGIAIDPTTGGYYEVASDGGIFAFTAAFHGSMGGGQPLPAPVVGMAVA